jgi:cytochrome c-type biogenesis protein
MITYLALGYLSGLLSLLAPCVLPLLPIILFNSRKISKLGPVVLATGLIFSFTIFGVLTSLFSSLFDPSTIQKMGAVLLIVIGVVLLIPTVKFYEKLYFLSHVGHFFQQRINFNGLFSEFLIGITLGMIWAPCSGPTLVFAYSLASQLETFSHALLIFIFYGLGASSGLLFLGLLLSKVPIFKSFIQDKVLILNRILGLISIFLGSAILSNKIEIIEEGLLTILPNWFIKLPTSF